jgi:hypothetical protein
MRILVAIVCGIVCASCGGLYIVEYKDAGDDASDMPDVACQFKDETLCDAGIDAP